MEIIGETVRGSHLWQMEDSESDFDIFQLRRESLRSVLDGTADFKPRDSKHKERHGTLEVDIVNHEISHVVQLLIKGNFTTLVNVLSTRASIADPVFRELQKVTKSNLSKMSYDSILGMALSCLHDMETTNDVRKRQKHINTALRTLQFGITMLMTGAIEFEAVKGIEDDIGSYIGLLETAHNESPLPDKPNEQVFRDWLVMARLE